MSAQTHASNLVALPRAAILAAVAAGVASLAWSGAAVPFATNDRERFIALVVLGWAMCSAGVGQVIRTAGWRSPVAAVGVAFGVANLALIAVVLTGNAGTLASGNVATGERFAVAALATLMLAKSLVALGATLLPERR